MVIIVNEVRTNLHDFVLSVAYMHLGLQTHTIVSQQQQGSRVQCTLNRVIAAVCCIQTVVQVESCPL